jgi:methanogenic corrinoid protein MtbC1
MKLQLAEIIKEAKGLPLVPIKATTIYQEMIPVLKKSVDDSLTSNPSINELIGNNPLKAMYDNHSHHAAFMLTVFSIGNYELLARTIPWVYRVYSAHHFSYDYFSLELNAWIDAIEKHTDPNINQEIKSVYAWMIKRHANMIYLSQTEKELKLPIRRDWLERKNSFLAGLLEGNHKKCLNIANESISDGKDIEKFYLHIIQPVMYEVGMLWERGEISVAQEHLASAIVGRVMAIASMVDVGVHKINARAVITSAPNEFHEIGAWMISDILEHEGWDVRYLGANTPVKDLLELLLSFKPKVLALSVTMPFNVLKAKEIIDAIKGDNELNKILIMVGGRAFNETPDLWRSTGADYYAAHAQEIKDLLHTLEEQWTILNN